MDTRSLTIARFHEIEDCDAISEEVKSAVRRIVCAYAEGVDHAARVADAEELMRALGVYPGTEDEVFVTPAAQLH